MTRDEIRATIEELTHLATMGDDWPHTAETARDALTLMRVMVGDNVGGSLPGTEGTITEWLISSEYVRETLEDLDRERKAVKS